MFYPSKIKSISPHTLDSIPLMKKHRIIEENEKLVHFWGSHPRFSKSYGIKISLYPLLANNWPIMHFLKTFTYFETLYCLGIQTTSPHTLDSIPFIYMCRIIEENKNWSILEGVICDFVKVLVSKLIFIHYWPIIAQLLANNWPIMDFFKTFTYLETLYCLGIQTSSPHILESIHVI